MLTDHFAQVVGQKDGMTNEVSVMNMSLSVLTMVENGTFPARLDQ
jgi:hypothetical protein